MKILIVDDCKYLANFCTMILSNNNHEVSTASTYDYRDALKENGGSFDILIYNHDPSNILESKTLLKEIPIVAPNTKVLILTMNWKVDQLSEFDHKILIIPFKISELIEAVEVTTEIEVVV